MAAKRPKPPKSAKQAKSAKPPESNLAVLAAERLGAQNYVRKADPARYYWVDFSVGPLADLREEHGSDFALIVHGDPFTATDFYVIPFAAVAHLFVDGTRTQGRDGRQRWIATIRKHTLHVNRAGNIDVARYYGRTDLLNGSSFVRNPVTDASDDGAGVTARSPGAGQGYERDPAVREAVELRAMEAARAYYEGQRFHVDDTSDGHPFDLRCTRNGMEVRVEAKGTRGDGSTVDVTIGEVMNAHGSGWRTDLYVVSRIEVTKTADGKAVARGGIERRIEGWHPAPEDLIATRFRCTVREPPKTA